MPSSSMSSTSYLQEEMKKSQKCLQTFSWFPPCSVMKVKPWHSDNISLLSTSYSVGDRVMISVLDVLTCWWSDCSWPPPPGSTARLRPWSSPSPPPCRPAWPRSRCWLESLRTEEEGWWRKTFICCITGAHQLFLQELCFSVWMY